MEDTPVLRLRPLVRRLRAEARFRESSDPAVGARIDSWAGEVERAAPGHLPALPMPEFLAFTASLEFSPAEAVGYRLLLAVLQATGRAARRG
jgi:hypothetical protein